MSPTEAKPTTLTESQTPSVTNSSHLDKTPAEKLKPASETDAYVIDAAAEKRLLRKLDWVFMPMFTAIFCCNFIDRTSVGNAKVAGLEEDLGMSGFNLNIALTVFYIFYNISDIPSNLLLKHVGSAWVSVLVTGFGLVTVFSAFMTNYAGLIASRVFLGITEGGTLSALVFILSRWYRRHELVLRVGIFFGIAPSIAGAFGGLLASGLLKINDFGIIKTWRKIFLIEGIATVVFGIALYFIVPEDPRTTKMLNEKERELALARMDADQVIKTQGRIEKTTWRAVYRSFNFMTCILILTFTMLNMSFQGLALFLPSVVRSLGTFSVIEVQLRTVPPYVASGAWVVLNSYISARLRKRWLPLLYNLMIVVAGYAIAVSTKNSSARYAACFLILMGASVGGPMMLIWGTDNAGSDTMRAVVTAAIPGIGAFGAILGVWTYLSVDAPDYRKGNLANLASVCTLCVLTVVIAAYIRWENRKRDRGERDYRFEGKSEEEIAKLGYKHPLFRYQI